MLNQVKFMNATQSSTDMRIAVLDANNPILYTQDETISLDWLNMNQTACAVTKSDSVNTWIGYADDQYDITQVDILHPNENFDYLEGAMVYVDRNLCGTVTNSEIGSWT